MAKHAFEKDQLFIHMKEKFPEVAKNHMVNSRQLKDVTIINFNEILIVKPVGNLACGGNDISICTSNSDLETARKLVQRYKNAVACTYIPNPLLWEGRKMYLRMYFMVRVEDKS